MSIRPDISPQTKLNFCLRCDVWHTPSRIVKDMRLVSSLRVVPLTVEPQVDLTFSESLIAKFPILYVNPRFPSFNVRKKTSASLVTARHACTCTLYFDSSLIRTPEVLSTAFFIAPHTLPTIFKHMSYQSNHLQPSSEVYLSDVTGSDVQY